MSEHISHEEYVAAVRRRVVETAENMLSGKVSYLEGARVLAGLRDEAAVPENDPDFRTFVAIDSETDDFPLGKVRQYWSADALAKLQPATEELEVWARELGEKVCTSLIRRFSV